MPPEEPCMDVGNRERSPERRSRMKVVPVSRRILFALLALLLAACADAGSSPIATNDEGSWRAAPPPPIAPRYGALAFDLDGRVLLVGGWGSDPFPPGADCVLPSEPPFADGALLDLDEERWSSIAPAPVPIAWASGAVLDGDLFLLAREVVDGRGTHEAFITYDADVNAWEELPLPPVRSIDAYVLEATEHSVVAYMSSQENGAGPDVEFDPARRTWSRLPPDPLIPSFDRTIVATDEGLVLTAIADVEQPGSDA